jgi:hypothetical protein
MRWVWLGLSVACFAIVFRTHSMGLAALCLVAALAFILLATLAFAAGRIEARSRNESTMLSGTELRAMREQAERRKIDGSAAAGTAPATGPQTPRRGEEPDLDSVSGADGSD